MESTKVILMNLPTSALSINRTGQEENSINRDSKLGLEHVGLLYLKTILEEAGIPTDAYDIEFQVLHGGGNSPEGCIDIVKERSPEIVGFSPYSTSIDNTFYVAEQIKRYSPKTKIILGGSHASHTANEILEDKPFIDAIFLGEAFGSIVPGIEALLEDRSLENVKGVAFREGGSVINTGWGARVPLDSLTMPKRSAGMYEKTKTASMMFSMGCLAACTFCSAESIRDHSWRSRSPDNLIAEIDYLTKQFGIEMIETHSDDGFGQGRDAVLHYTAFAQKLLEGNYNIRWRSVLRATDFRDKGALLDDDFWRLLHQSGLERVYIGFEGGTNDRLRKIKKPATVESNLKAYRFLTEKGIFVQYGFIMFFPDSTVDEIRANQDFLYQLRSTSYKNCSSSFMVCPGSAYFDMLRMDGRLQRPYYGMQHYDFADASIKQMHDAYRRFALDQKPIDILCNDVESADLCNNENIVHLGRELRVDTAVLEKRAKELHSTGISVLQKPEDALVILREFNERWRQEYKRYLKENATVALSYG